MTSITGEVRWGGASFRRNRDGATPSQDLGGPPGRCPRLRHLGALVPSRQTWIWVAAGWKDEKEDEEEEEEEEDEEDEEVEEEEMNNKK